MLSYTPDISGINYMDIVVINDIRPAAHVGTTLGQRRTLAVGLMSTKLAGFDL
jgi:tetrahydromethanopterin S-methyltransferase subunit F